MTDQLTKQIDSLIARWKKVSASEDAERLSALEHAPTSELQRLIKEFEEEKPEIDKCLKELETKYGVLETGELGANAQPSPQDDRRHKALLALRLACEEAAAEIEDRELGGEA